MTRPDRTAEIAHLKREQANAVMLYLQYKGYHWNVVGPRFPELHRMFDEHAATVLASIDELAERQRMLGAPAAYGLEELRAAASLPDERHLPTTPKAMLEHLIRAHRTVLDGLGAAFETAEEDHDAATADLLAKLLGAHEKMEWFLRETAVEAPNVPDEPEAKAARMGEPHGLSHATPWGHAVPVQERTLSA